MGKSDRLKEAFEFLKSKGVVHTQRDLAKRMGATAPNVSSAFKGDPKVLTDSFINRLNDAFDGIFNKEWLLKGEGDMLRDVQINIGDGNTATQINKNNNILDNITNNYPALEENRDREMYNIIPLLPISAQGGTLNDFIISIKDSDCEKIISPIKGVDYAISVSGDSMAPEYPPGSQILIKRINEKAFIDWGRVYVLDTCNGTVIKKLLPSNKSDAVVCKSINPEYPPFEVSFVDIFGIYRVLMCMASK